MPSPSSDRTARQPEACGWRGRRSGWHDPMPHSGVDPNALRAGPSAFESLLCLLRRYGEIRPVVAVALDGAECVFRWDFACCVVVVEEFGRLVGGENLWLADHLGAV